MNGEYFVRDEVHEDIEQEGCLETVFKDGKLLKDYTLAEVRANVDNTI